MKVRNVEAPATALMSTMLAHDTVEPALDAASQRKVGAVDCQDQAAIEHTRIEPVGQDELDANGSATVVAGATRGTAALLQKTQTGQLNWNLAGLALFAVAMLLLVLLGVI